VTTVLVTGGCGFVGANLVPLLVGDGHRVRVLDNLVTGRTDYLAGTGADVHVGDICDRDLLTRLSEGADAVVHLAAAGSVVDSVADPAANFRANVLGTFTVLDVARSTGVERVVAASTGGALIGNAPPPVDENSLPKPISPYGAGKLAGEGYCHAFAHSYGLRTICLRFANVYGPFSGHKKGAITTFFRAVHEDRPIVIYGDGAASRDFMHSSDIAAALMLALTADVDGGTVMHVASGIETTVAELARLCAEAAGHPDHPIRHEPARPGEVVRNFASYDLAAKLIGFHPRVALRDGLADTWTWYREHVF
jgi:UDP-glucose 4-epimerase